jgi:hypothetical protein
LGNRRNKSQRKNTKIQIGQKKSNFKSYRNGALEFDLFPRGWCFTTTYYFYHNYFKSIIHLITGSAGEDTSRGVWEPKKQEPRKNTKFK